MKFDAFTAGVEFGGLRSKDDIKLLICYMLSSVDQPLTKDEIVSILQENSLANYFEINDALSDLFENKNIIHYSKDSSKYVIAESGRLIANQLDISLPISVREKTLSAAINLLAKIKRESENTATIKKTNAGCYVSCNISGGNDLDLLNVDIFVPDSKQAELVKRNFQENPNLIYSCMLALLTHNSDLVKEALENINEQYSK